MTPDDETNTPLHDADLAPVTARLDEVTDLVRRISSVVGPASVLGADAIIQRNRDAVYAAMEALGNAIHEFMGSEPSPDRLAAAQQLVVEGLFAVSIASPTASFVTHDKNHRPSYFELVKHMRAGQAAGADVGARVIDDYFVHSRMGEAYVSWLHLLRGRLVEEASDWLSVREQPLHFVSLQYIGGFDLLPLAEVTGKGGSCRLTCLDENRDAVRDAEQTLKSAFGSRVRCQKAEPLRWLEGPDCGPGSASVIYAESLLQRLPDKRVARLLQAAHRALQPGGVLLLGCAPGKPPVAEQMIREWLLQPEWRFRGEDECRSLFAGSPFGAAGLRFDYEPLGINALLRVQKGS